MAKKLIVGNWKMNPQSQKEAEVLFKSISTSIEGVKNTEVAICAPFTFLPIIYRLHNKKIALGAQDVFFEPKGAYTGEVSLSMLTDLNVRYVIVGHSERRSHGETNEDINKKVSTLLKSNVTPILCVGESARGQDGAYLSVVKDQLISGTSGIPKNKIKGLVIAYEPVWALSSTPGRHDATAHDFEEMKIYIRKNLTDMFGQSVAASVRILYGGSVNKNNAREFLEKGADGLLPGKASLTPKEFYSIIQIASTIK